MENLLWALIVGNILSVFYCIRISRELTSLRGEISDLHSSVNNIDAKADYIESIDDKLNALSEKLYPHDPDKWMSQAG